METLFIKLTNENADLAQWVVLDETGNPHAAVRQGPLSEISDVMLKQRRVVCAIPGHEVLLESTVLPANRNRKKVHQAVPFALEDELADDLEELHFALGTEEKLTTEGEENASNNAIRVPVAIINKARLEHYLGALNNAGIKPHVLIPDVLAVPYQDHQWNVHVGENGALIHTQAQQGFACDLYNLPMLLGASLDEIINEELPVPDQIRIWNHNGEVPHIDLSSQIEVELTSVDNLEVTTLAKGYNKNNQINLLQGPYSYQQEYGKLIKPWKIPAILLVILIAVNLISNVIENHRLKNEMRELGDNMVALYKQVAPDARNVPDPRGQMEGKLRELGGAGGSSNFLKLLNYIGAELANAPGIKITSLNFSSDHLDAELSVPTLAHLDILKQKLDEKPDIATEIQSAQSEGEQVTGRLRITSR